MTGDMRVNEKLEEHGYSLTKPRSAVFGLLEAADRPMDIQEIIGQLPSVDRATVYRTLELFEKLQIAQKLWLGNSFKYELSDHFVEHHHHLVCTRCGIVEKVDSSLIERQINRISRTFGFDQSHHSLEIMGVCYECQQELEEKKK